MSRPTMTGLHKQAEEWMTTTFGEPLGDYLQAATVQPVGLAVVEVDRLLKATEVRRLLTSATQRTILKLSHDSKNERGYDRIWGAVQRLIALVDEFPGRRDKVLTQAEFQAVIEARDPADCLKHRKRMFTLANELLHGTWKLLPAELRERYAGNVAIDATKIPLLGKAGNPAAKNLDGNRRSVNYDGGYYGRNGNHAALTRADAKALNKLDRKAKHKDSSTSKRTWAIEGENARMTANTPGGEEDLFPLMTTAVSFHIPGAIAGEGARLVDSICSRGIKVNLVLVDRAYPHGRFRDFHVPIRISGAKLVFDDMDIDLGVKAHDARGFVQVSGYWYLDNLPDVLREADRAIRTARSKYSPPWAAVPMTPELRKAQRELAKAEELYSMQLARREKYRLKPKGRMSADVTRRYFIPDPSAGSNRLNVKPHRYTKSTVIMTLPETPKTPQEEDKEDANAGGLKHEQYFPFGTPEWKAAYGMRNGVESVNKNVKSRQFEDIANADHRAVRGNTFTYIAYAIACVVENMRQMLSFYKRKLAVTSHSAKTTHLPEAFHQSAPARASTIAGPQPPG